jgi:iron(III) transport system permease protein
MAEQLVPFLRTLGVAGIAAAVALGLGLAYAVLLARWRVSRLFVVLGVAPLVVPPYIAAIGWVDVFGPAGLVPRFLGFELPGGPSLIATGLVYTTPSAGVLLGCCFFPLVFLSARAALRRVPGDALDAARLARGAAGERWLLASAALPHAIVAGLVVFALSAVEFAVPQLLRIKVLSESAYLAMSENSEPLVTLVRSLPLVALVALAVGFAATRLRVPLVGGGAVLEPKAPGTRQRAEVAGFCLLAVTPAFLLPAASLVLRLVHDPAGGDGGFLRAKKILSDAVSNGGQDAIRSVEVGALTVLLVLSLAFVLAWTVRRIGPRARGPTAWGALALTALPAPLVGVGVIWALNRDALLFFYDGLGPVVVANVLRFGPLAFLILWVALQRIDVRQEEAATLADRLALTGVALPQIAPSLSAAALVTYVLTVTEFGASALVAPPGESVLSVFLVNEAHYGQGTELSGLCVLLLAVALVPAVPLAAAGFAMKKRWSP